MLDCFRPIDLCTEVEEGVGGWDGVGGIGNALVSSIVPTKGETVIYHRNGTCNHFVAFVWKLLNTLFF